MPGRRRRYVRRRTRLPARARQASIASPGTRMHSRATAPRLIRCGEHVADVLSESLACGCRGRRGSRDPRPSERLVGPTATRVEPRKGPSRGESFRRVDRYIRARSAERSKMVSRTRVARARVSSARHRSRVFRQARSPG